jgi:hypothetical protein
MGPIGAALQEGELIRVEQLAAARLHEMAGMAFVNQSKQGEQTAPTAAPLVHGVGIECGILAQACIESPERIARLINFPRTTVRARGQEIAVFGIESKDEPHEDREEPLVQMRGPRPCQLADEIGLGGI